MTDRPLTPARSTAEPPVLPAAVELPLTQVLATPATVPVPPMPDTTALPPIPDTAAIPPTQASALGRDGVHEHVTNIRMTDKTDSHPTVEPAHVSSHILEGTAHQSIHNDMHTETELWEEVAPLQVMQKCNRIRRSLHRVSVSMVVQQERRTVGPMHIMQCMGSCGMRWSREQSDV